MRAGDHALVRERRVVQEHRLVHDVAQQQSGRDDHEIRFAKRDQPFVVEQRERQAGGGLRHRQNGAHAGLDGERRRVVLLHQLLEQPVKHEGVHHELPLRLQAGVRQGQVALAPSCSAAAITLASASARCTRGPKSS